MKKESIKKTKDELREIVKVIESPNAVGIDPQLTHAIIIDYLRNLHRRLDRLEKDLFKQINQSAQRGRK